MNTLQNVLLLDATAVTTACLLMLCPASARAQGGVPLWTNRYPGAATAQAVDRGGNVLVTAAVPAISNLFDYVTIKFSNAGVPLWTNRWPANGPSGMAVDPSGNVFVTASLNDDWVTIKYSAEGVLLWTNRYHGSQSYLSPIAVDSGGNVLVTGGSWNGSDWDYATIKYSNAGVALWTNTYDGSFSDFPYAVAVDNSGNVFVTGQSRDSSAWYYCVTVAYSSEGDLLWINTYDASGGWGNAITVDSAGNVFVTAESNYYLTIKYSGAGDLLWTNRYTGPANNGDKCRAIAADASGNVFVAGFSQNADSVRDYVTVAYSNAGVPLWTRRYNGPGNVDDEAIALAVDSAGNVFVTGNSYTAYGSSTSDIATLGYSNAGVPLWTKRYHGSGKENYASAIAVDRTGNVFVTGRSHDSNVYGPTNLESATIKYSTSIPLPRLDFQRLNNQLVLSWTNAGFNLQSAPALTGPFTTLPAATSPYTNPFTAPQQFFRLISN